MTAETVKGSGGYVFARKRPRQPTRSACTRSATGPLKSGDLAHPATVALATDAANCFLHTLAASSVVCQRRSTGVTLG